MFSSLKSKCSQLFKFSSKNAATSRKIAINPDECIIDSPFVKNEISTAKYTVFSFLFKFLFEQFRRYANIFFLVIGLLQQIPNVSPTGRFVTIVPFSIILALTAVKEIIEDAKRHFADRTHNRRLVQVLSQCRFRKAPTTVEVWEEVEWRDVRVGDIVRINNAADFPADLLLLASSEPHGMCYIETSNLDGETNLKIRSALKNTAVYNTEESIQKFQAFLTCEPPNREIYEFRGNLNIGNTCDVPIPASAILLRGSRLMNSAWVYGAVIYTGHETKLLMNSTVAPLKRSNVDKITNNQIVILFFVLVAISFISASANEVQRKISEEHESYVGVLESNDFLSNFLTFFILYNNLIPISLQVTLEMIKFLQSYFINWDLNMYDSHTQTFASARTSNLNEELGQVNHVFTDKTGTLTRNIMEFKACSIAGNLYGTETFLQSEDECDNPNSGNLSSRFRSPQELIERLKSWQISLKENSSLLMDHDEIDATGSLSDECEVINDFMTSMVVCHSVIAEDRKESESADVTDATDDLFYNAASPDEKALVEGVIHFGFKFLSRRSLDDPDKDCVVFRTPHRDTLSFQILNLIEFTSLRKRMSVIMRDTSTNTLRLVMKGADSVIYERLRRGNAQNERLYIDTIAHLEKFASDGFRTLCYAMRELNLEEYEEWNKRYKMAETLIGESREYELNSLADEIEQDLVLLGATAIEDKLQDGVPETIASLLQANILVWMLTGDKVETAINIGHSCKLLDDTTQLIKVVEANSSQNVEELIETALNDCKEGGMSSNNKKCLVIDGKSLSNTLSCQTSLIKLISLCKMCCSVLCCRVSPIQKAQVVGMVQNAEHKICMAIGDGANDVAMIQKADVGVAIYGQEGLQAANSSDFSIAQFKFLAPLLFVHGAWNYDRITKVTLYSFYKNICLYLIEFWFAFVNFWSGQVLFERWTIGMYNIFFTSLPPLAMGIFDRLGGFNADMRLKHPKLYNTGNTPFTSIQSHLKSTVSKFDIPTFWGWILVSVWHSIVLFLLPMLSYTSDVVWSDGKTGDYLVVGNFVYTYVVISVCVKSLLTIDSWSWPVQMSIYLSLLNWFVFLVVYSQLWGMGLPFAANMVAMSKLMFTSPVFWLSFILVPVVTLLPDIVYRSLLNTVWPSHMLRLRDQLKQISESDPESSGSSVHQSPDRISEKSNRRGIRSQFGMLGKLSKRVMSVHAGNGGSGSASCLGGGERRNNSIELNTGFAFSQDECGPISQSEYLRRKRKWEIAKLKKGNTKKDVMKCKRDKIAKIEQQGGHKPTSSSASILDSENKIPHTVISKSLQPIRASSQSPLHHHHKRSPSHKDA